MQTRIDEDNGIITVTAGPLYVKILDISYPINMDAILADIRKNFTIMGNSHALICRVIDTKRNETVSSVAIVSDIAFNDPDNSALVSALKTLLCEFKGFSPELNKDMKQEALKAIATSEQVYSINRRDGFLHIILKERQ
jgi:hypothetical protein